MSEDAKRDQDFVTSLLCYNETTGGVEPARVDPSTGALLVLVVTEDSTSPASIENAKRDQNDVESKLAYNETTRLTEAIRLSSSNSLIIKSV